MKFSNKISDNLVKTLYNMGNCTGCTNPERSLRSKALPRQQSLPTRYESAQIQKSNSRQQVLYNSMNLYVQPNQHKNKMGSSIQDPWKSRIASRTIKKYVRVPTLRQQQQMAHGMFSLKEKENENSGDNIGHPNLFTAYKHQPSERPIRAESLEESIDMRRNLGQKQSKQVYKMQYNQEFCEEVDQIQQFINLNTSQTKRFSPKTSPSNKTYSPASTFSKSQKFQPPARYLPKKQDKLREKQLDQIMEMVEKDAETPCYVKSIRKQNGEDVKMNNFHKFDAVGHFQWFSIGKYLSQIDKQQGEEPIDKNKLLQISQRQKEQSAKKQRWEEDTIKKKPNLLISIQQQQ